jgi:hypothetical protein
MEPIIRKYSSFDEMKADEYRYWQSCPVHERLDAAEELILEAYKLKGEQLGTRCTKTTKTFCPPSKPMALNTSLSEATLSSFMRSRASGLKAFFISRDDLIAAKLATARPQDLADVDAIRKATESVQPSNQKKPPDPTQSGGPNTTMSSIS